MAARDEPQHERITALLAAMEAESGLVPGELLAEASTLWEDRSTPT